MTGFETVLLRVAGTAAGALVRSALSRAPGAGLTTDPARPVPRWRRPPADLGDPEIRRLTETLAARMGPVCAALPEHERLAAVTAVGDAFTALGRLDADTLFAADLDPEVRRETEARTAELLPPQRLSQAEELAKAGELVLDLLPGPLDLSAAEAAAVVHTASRVGGHQALRVVTGFRSDSRPQVTSQLANCWQFFDRADYVDTVLTEVDLSATYLPVQTAEELAQLDRLPATPYLHLRGGFGIPSPVMAKTGLEGLSLQENELLADLSPLARFNSLVFLGLHDCPRVQTLSPLSELPLRSLTLNRMRAGLPLEPLASLGSLTHVSIGFDADLPDLARLPAPDSLRSLGLLEGISSTHLHGLERWPDLNSLFLFGEPLISQLVTQPPVPALRTLQLINAAVTPSDLVRYEQLTQLLLLRCSLTTGMEPLLALSRLTQLTVSHSIGPIDLSPLAAKEDLVIEVYGPNNLLGAELFPPERLVRMT
ncbi:hypothetical protein [Streptomyces yangpuensis]|uniref:NACHT N-terminal Helical domain 1-containing protein n=1 Tax=Streptomyces yangpuensis TaxID=1648182 RepID=UPI00371767C2